jgi:uncharacterized protein (DUF3820 family)
MKMPFGKYKDQEVEDIPSYYLEWILTNVPNLTPSLQQEMENQLNAREGKGIDRGKAKTDM